MPKTFVANKEEIKTNDEVLKDEKVAEKENVPMVSDKENIFRIEKTLENEIEQSKELNKELLEIKDLLIKKEEQEKKELELIKKEELENIQKEKKELELIKKEELEKENLENERFSELIETISTPDEYESIKEELTLFNNNIVGIYESSLIFFGFVISILISSIFLRGVFK